MTDFKLDWKKMHSQTFALPPPSLPPPPDQLIQHMEQLILTACPPPPFPLNPISCSSRVEQLILTAYQNYTARAGI